MTEFVNKNKTLLLSIAALSFSLILYLATIKALLIPALLVHLILFFPFPSLFRSVFSRTIVSIFLLYSTYQISATAQSFLLPESGFVAGAIIATLLTMLLTAPLLAQKLDDSKLILFQKKDLAALLTGCLFIVPVLMFIFSGSAAVNTTAIGGIQGIDGTNHFDYISQHAQSQHLTYETGKYYPFGFHLTTAFFQDSFGISQAELSWESNTHLFLAHYLIWGLLLAYLIFYLCIALLQNLYKQKSRPEFLVALSLAAPVSLLYLLPFMYRGFLSYYYVCGAVVLALIFILEFLKGASTSRQDFSNSQRAQLFAFLLLTYGVSMSWTLLALPLLLIAGFCILPDSFGQMSRLKYLLKAKNRLILGGLLLQLLPIIIMIKYSGPGASQALSGSGGLAPFHPGPMLAGLVLVGLIIFNQKLDTASRYFTSYIFQAFYIFIIFMISWQYFTLGEIRYYPVKSAYIIELLLITFLVAWLINRLASINLDKLKHSLVVPLLAFVIPTFLIALSANPLQDVRSMFRDFSGEAKPTYFTQDVEKFADLGKRDKLDDFNNTLLHYDPKSGKFYSHLQIPVWANMMTFGASMSEQRAKNCTLAQFKKLLFGDFSVAGQTFLKEQIRTCAKQANKEHRQFFIVTDQNSAPYIKEQFGDVADVIW